MEEFNTLVDATRWLNNNDKHLVECKGNKCILNTGESILIKNNPLT